MLFVFRVDIYVGMALSCRISRNGVYKSGNFRQLVLWFEHHATLFMPDTKRNEEVSLDTEWFKVLYEYGAAGNYQREIEELLEHTDPRSSPDWPQICEWGRELMPDEEIFQLPGAAQDDQSAATRLSEFSDAFHGLADEFLESPVLKKVSSETQAQRENALAKFREMCGDYYGEKIALGKVYIELDAARKAAPLLIEALRMGPEKYHIDVMEMLDEIDADIVIEAMAAADAMLHNGNDSQRTPLNLRALGEMSEQFKILASDEASTRLVLSQIYLELDDVESARAHVSDCMADGELGENNEANHSLFKRISERLDSLDPGEDDTENVKSGAVPQVVSRANEVMQELSSCFQRLSGDEHTQKLALAYFHIKLKDYDLARKLILDVMDEGGEDYFAEARRLNARIKTEQER